MSSNKIFHDYDIQEGCEDQNYCVQGHDYRWEPEEQLKFAIYQTPRVENKPNPKHQRMFTIKAPEVGYEADSVQSDILPDSVYAYRIYKIDQVELDLTNWSKIPTEEYVIAAKGKWFRFSLHPASMSIFVFSI